MSGWPQAPFFLVMKKKSGHDMLHITVILQYIVNMNKYEVSEYVWAASVEEKKKLSIMAKLTF